MSYYVHSLPGRLKIKGQEFKKRKRLGEEIRNELNKLNGLRDIEYNPTTGSLIIWYDHRFLQASEILNHLREKGYFDHHKALNHEDYLVQLSVKLGKRLSKIVFDSVGEAFLAGSPLTLLFKLL